MGTTYRDFGSIRKLPSGRHHASYRYLGQRFNGPDTFKTSTEAKDWLVLEHAKIRSNLWTHPALLSETKVAVPTFGDATRRHINLQTTKDGTGLKPLTKVLYYKCLRNELAVFDSTPIDAIDEAAVAEWWANQISTGKISSASKAYKLLSAVMKRAKAENQIESNPATVRGAQNATSERELFTPSLAEVKVLIEHITPRYRVLIRVLAGSGLRFGEVTALTRGDVKRHDDEHGAFYVLNVNKAVCYVDKEFILGKPKSKSGNRKQRLPRLITAELDEFFGTLPFESEDLVFPGASGHYLRNDVLNTSIKRALKAAGMKSVGFSVHSLRTKARMSQR
jgi:integrase